MAAKKTKRVVVRSRFYSVKPERRTTRHIQLKSGKLKGRRVVPSNKQSRTNVIRLTSDFDVNKDGKIDHRDLRKGQIIGRSSKGIARPKHVVINRHWRNGRKVKTHNRTR